jgi:hypothetical protein
MENDMIEIFAGTPWQAGMVKTMLEDNGIQAFLKDEILGTLYPWWAAPGGAGSVKVEVPAVDYEKARVIVAGYERNLGTED